MTLKLNRYPFNKSCRLCHPRFINAQATAFVVDAQVFSAPKSGSTQVDTYLPINCLVTFEFQRFLRQIFSKLIFLLENASISSSITKKLLMTLCVYLTTFQDSLRYHLIKSPKPKLFRS